MVNYIISYQSNLLERDLNIIRKEAKKKSRIIDYRILDFGKIENNVFVLYSYLTRPNTVLQLKLFKRNSISERIMVMIYQNAITNELFIEKLICNKSVVCIECISKIINQIIIYGINRDVKLIKGEFPLSKIADEVLLAFKWLQFSINIAEGKVSFCLKL